MNKAQYAKLQRQLSEQTHGDMGFPQSPFYGTGICMPISALEQHLKRYDLYDGIIASPEYAGGVVAIPSENELKEYGKCRSSRRG